MAAGRLNQKLSFQQRQLVSDGYGNSEGDFAEEFIRWAGVKPSLGIETNAQARLAGQQRVDIEVYRDSDTRLITAAWRAVDVNEGTVYAITSPAMDMKQNRMLLTMSAVTGAAP